MDAMGISRIRPYRGLTKDGEMVYGFHCEVEGKHYIFTPYRLGKSCGCCDGCDCEEDSIETGALVEVIPETVGQSTGIKDKDKKEVYAGDIVVNAKVDRKDYGSDTLKDCVVVVEMGNDWPLILNESERLIIGNIHQQLLDK